MKVTLEFENKEDAISAMRGNDWHQLVRDLDQSLRNHIKYSEKDEPELQIIRDRLYELLSDYNLTLE
jgi:hypothetical protein